MWAQLWRRSHAACGAAPASGSHYGAGSWLKVQLSKPQHLCSMGMDPRCCYLEDDCYANSDLPPSSPANVHINNHK
jgi:hypothetical protein